MQVKAQGWTQTFLKRIWNIANLTDLCSLFMIFEPAVGQYLFLLARSIGEFYTSLFVRVNVLRQSLCQPFVSPPFGSSNKLHQHFTELDICCSCFLFQFCQKPVYLLLNHLSGGLCFFLALTKISGEMIQK